MRSVLRYSWTIYTCDLRDIFTFFLAAIYAGLLGIGFQYHEYALKEAVDDTYVGGSLQILPVDPNFANIGHLRGHPGASQDLSAAGKISVYPIVALLGGNCLESFHRGIQERYFTEIIMDTYKAITGCIPKSQFKTQSVFDTVLLYDKSIIVNWSFTSTWRTSQRFLPLESFF